MELAGSRAERKIIQGPSGDQGATIWGEKHSRQMSQLLTMSNLIIK